MQPIDPRDSDGILEEVRNAVYEQMSAHDRLMIANDYATNQATQIAINATAFSVCPEHHAVFDARTHVAVPVSDLRVALDWHGSAPEPVDAKNRIRSLIPKEATDE